MSSSSSAAATAAPTSPANPRSRVVLASLIGTTIEFYDFYVYATAAVLVFVYRKKDPAPSAPAPLSARSLPLIALASTGRMPRA